MKKMIYIANIRLPTEKAHGIQIMKTCEALAKQGIALELIIPNRKTPITQDPFDFYGVERVFEITRLPCIDLVSGGRFGAIGFWLQSWLFCRAVQRYIQEKKGDIYYTRDLPVASWLSSQIQPFFYEIHTLPDIITPRYRQVWQRMKGLIVISDGLKQALIREGCAEEKICVARDAVDVEKFTVHETKQESRQRLGLPLEQKIVLYTGHLYKWKGAHVLAQAASIVQSSVHIYLVGGTEPDVLFFRKTFQSKNLHVVGWRSQEEIPFWLHAADLLVIPNSAKEKISALYTSPLKLFEYLAAKTPILLADLPSLREVVGEHGFFFLPDNADSLAKNIQKILNLEMNRTHKQGGERECVADLSWSHRAKVIEKFINKLIWNVI